MLTRLRLLLTVAFGLAVLAACGTGAPPTANFELEVTVAGDGTGTVTSSPAGISVTTGSDSQEFASGTAVTLTATPAAGSEFASWGGACTGSALTCTVTMSAARTVTATFQPEDVLTEYTLTVNVTGTGDGRVTSDVGEIDVTTGTDSAILATSTVVTLTAAADAGSVFAGWTGACTDTELTCTVTMDGTRDVTAQFNLEGTGGETTVSYTITDSAESAEEFRQASDVDPIAFPAGYTYMSSGDLELGFDPAHASQYVGLRFTGVAVPQGAVLTSAVLGFTGYTPAPGESGRASAVNLLIAAEDVDSAAAFVQDANGAASSGISSRTMTAPLTWNIPAQPLPGWTAGEAVTVDVTTVAQPVIDRAGWATGNAIVLIVYADSELATAFRRAEESGVAGPTLQIVYSVP